jgi:integrase
VGCVLCRPNRQLDHGAVIQHQPRASRRDAFLVTRLVALLLYGSGMRLMECLTLRVKDLDSGRGEIRIRRGKSAKDRVTVLPDMLRTALVAHVEFVRGLHERDCAIGVDSGWVALPDALARKYPQAGAFTPVAVGFSSEAPVHGSSDGPAAASSPTRVGRATRDGGGRTP